MDLRPATVTQRARRWFIAWAVFWTGLGTPVVSLPAMRWRTVGTSAWRSSRAWPRGGRCNTRRDLAEAARLSAARCQELSYLSLIVKVVLDPVEALAKLLEQVKCLVVIIGERLDRAGYRVRRSSCHRSECTPAAFPIMS